MSPWNIRILLASEDSHDSIIVSRKKLGELIEEVDKLRKERDLLRENARKLSDEKKAVEKELKRLKTSLPVLGTDGRTAASVGVPSSRVFFKQPRPPPGERRSPGGQPGHKGVTRSCPTPNAPPLTLTLRVCPRCTHALGRPADSSRHTVTDLPEQRLTIFDVVTNRYYCPGCGERVSASVPEGYRGEFGPRLKAFVSHLRAVGVPIEKIVEILDGTFRLTVSAASLISMEDGTAESLDRMYQDLGEEMRDSSKTPHAQGDETSIPIKGETEWMWVGTSPTATIYHIQPTRSGSDAEEMWKGYTGTLTHDGYEAYNSAQGVVHQMDLVHVNRWLQKAEAGHGIETRGFMTQKPPKFTRRGRPPSELLEFIDGVRERLAVEVRWVEGHEEAPLGERRQRYGQAVWSMWAFLAREWRDEDAVRISGAIRQRLNTLDTFVRVRGTPWNSNEAERELRVAVVHRKISGGRRTERGAWVLERLLTVWRTCMKRGLRFRDVVMGNLGVPQSGLGPPSTAPWT